MKAYCLQCKSKQEIENPIISKSGLKSRVSGLCSGCKKKISSFTKGSASQIERNMDQVVKQLNQPLEKEKEQE